MSNSQAKERGHHTRVGQQKFYELTDGWREVKRYSQVKVRGQDQVKVY